MDLSKMFEPLIDAGLYSFAFYGNAGFYGKLDFRVLGASNLTVFHFN